MALIQNEGRRPLGLPGRVTDSGAVAAFALAPKETAEVPDWYVAELLEEPGTADLLSRGELAIADAPAEPVAAAPEPRREVGTTRRSRSSPCPPRTSRSRRRRSGGAGGGRTPGGDPWL